MKDFFRDNWKIAAACALGAFLLSLFIGLIASNPFGVALLRAFLFAVFFAGLGVGARLAAQSYLPGLVAASQGARLDPQESRGQNIDIILPEENGISRSRPRTDSRASGDAERSTEPGDTPPDGEAPDEAAALDENSAARAEARALGELAEELPSASEPAPGGAEDSSGLGETVESSPGKKGGRGGPSSAPGGLAGGSAAEDLDALPDISTLEIAVEEPSGTGSRRTAERETPQDAMRGAVSGQDPVTIARAIRTVLKRDEKG